MTTQTPGCGSNSDAKKRQREAEAARAETPDTTELRDRRCWRGECRNACAYEPNCSEKEPTHPYAIPDMILRAARDLLEIDDGLIEEYRNYAPEDMERLQAQIAQATASKPLVTIDPDDREQVERLTQAYLDQFGSGSSAALIIDQMQAAFREFVKPDQPTPPKPAEPTGLGAVVEDADGNRWVRSDIATTSPWRNPWGIHSEYVDIDAVCVLSEGVQPEATAEVTPDAGDVEANVTISALMAGKISGPEAVAAINAKIASHDAALIEQARAEGKAERDRLVAAIQRMAKEPARVRMPSELRALLDGEGK